MAVTNYQLDSVEDIKDFMISREYKSFRTLTPQVYKTFSLSQGNSWKDCVSVLTTKMETQRTNRLRFVFTNKATTPENWEDDPSCECFDITFLLVEVPTTAQIAGVGNVQAMPIQPQYMPQYPIGSAEREALENDITARLETRFKAQELERREKELNEKEKEYREKESGVMGLLVQYLAPVAQHLLGAKKVAGVDNGGEDFVAEEKIKVLDKSEKEVKVFADDEADKLFELMERFRKVEPRYLELIENVVIMAEKGDGMYNTAKSFLLK